MSNARACDSSITLPEGSGALDWGSNTIPSGVPSTIRTRRIPTGRPHNDGYSWRRPSAEPALGSCLPFPQTVPERSAHRPAHASPKYREGMVIRAIGYQPLRAPNNPASAVPDHRPPCHPSAAGREVMMGYRAFHAAGCRASGPACCVQCGGMPTICPGSGTRFAGPQAVVVSSRVKSPGFGRGGRLAGVSRV